jgi:hypothetical protein
MIGNYSGSKLEVRNHPAFVIKCTKIHVCLGPFRSVYLCLMSEVSPGKSPTQLVSHGIFTPTVFRITHYVSFIGPEGSEVHNIIEIR